MSIYGAVANGVKEFQNHQRAQVDQAYKLSQAPLAGPDDQEDITQRALKLDRIKQNLDFANGVAEEILKNLAQLQP
jgi:hypothetical protein